jgi:hypothetical protein
MNIRPRNANGSFARRSSDLNSKTCSRCSQEKPTHEYFTARYGYLGVGSRCKRCLLELQRAYRALRKKPARRKCTPEEIRAKERAYHARTKHRFAERLRMQSRRQYERSKQKPMFRLVQRIRAGLRQSLHGSKQARTEEMLGYRVADLRKHLERQFLRGMSWNNMGEWHIDHIVPVSAFNFSSHLDEDFKRCWSLANLRPLWAEDNLRKGARIGSII